MACGNATASDCHGHRADVPAATLHCVTGAVCPDPAKRPLRFLLEGHPKVGKTVAIRRLVQLLQARGTVVSGFVTDEIRERGRRVGFVVRDVAGPQAVLERVAVTEANRDELAR